MKRYFKLAILFLLFVLIILALFFAKDFLQKTSPSESTKPMIHDIVLFSANREQEEVVQGDTLRGKGIPEGTVTILVSPNGDEKNIPVDKEGNFTYEIPKTLKEGKYRLTVLMYDSLDKLATLKTYPLAVVNKKSSGGKKQSFDTRNIFFPKAYAQGSGELTCSLTPAHPEYDCSNGRKCFNDYVVDTTSCRLDVANYTSHCDENITECNGLGTGWKGDPLNGTSSTSGCGNPNEQANQTREEFQSATSGEYCFRYYFRDESTQCQWQEDVTIGRNGVVCGPTRDWATRPQPPEQRQEEYVLLHDHFGREEYERNWKSWERLLRAHNRYPVWGNTINDIIYLNRDTFRREVCEKQRMLCTLGSPLSEAEQEQLRADMADITIEYLIALGTKLAQQCYIPFVVLEEYFPEEIQKLKGPDDSNLPRDFPSLIPFFEESSLRGSCIGNAKESISPEDLEQLVASSESHNFFESRMTDRILDRDAEFFATGFRENPILNFVFSLEAFDRLTLQSESRGRHSIFSDEDLLNIALVLPVGKAGKVAGGGFKLFERTAEGLRVASLDMVGLAGDLRTINSAIARGEMVPQEVFASAVRNRNVGRGVLRRGRILRNLRPNSPSIMRELGHFFENGTVYVMDPNISRPVMEDLIQRLATWNGGVLKSRFGLQLDLAKIMATIDNNWVIVLKDEVFDSLRICGRGTPSACASSGVVYIRESISTDAFTLYHEFVHTISFTERGYFKYFSYNLEQADKLGRLFSVIYELMTDHVVETVVGLGGGYYKGLHPRIYASIVDHLIPNLIQRSRGTLSEADFMRFALTEDVPELLKAIFSRFTPGEFIQFVKQEIDLDKLTGIVSDALDKHIASERSINPAYFIVPGVVVVGGAEVHFTTSVINSMIHGQPPSNNAVIISGPPLEFNGDVDLRRDSTTDIVVIIDGISGEPKTGNNVSVSYQVVSDGSVVEDLSPFSTAARLTRAGSSGSIGSFLCQQTLCQISIPQDAQAGDYTIVIELSNKATSSTPVVSTSYSIGITSSAQATIIPPVQQPSNCRAPYERCGGTDGYEQYDKTHTILIRPICDSNGKVINREVEDERNTGECPRQ